MCAHPFEAPCPACGVVPLDRDQLWLVLTPWPLPDHVAFYCPRCSALTRRHAGPGAVTVLSGEVAVEELDVPAEALEPRRTDPLTEDDLIGLKRDLDRWHVQPRGGPGDATDAR
jgi:predicted RNA-binding Zn-ribbon protein involved in translation (DUF1610 family)